VKRFFPWILVLAACSAAASDPATQPPATEPPPASGDDGTTYPDITLPEEPQRPGDPTKGYHALVNEAYVPCGIPDSAFSQLNPDPTPDEIIPGREGRNATLAYNWTSYTTKDGVKLVTSNCLTCHAGRMQGKLIVGLGAADGNYVQDPSLVVGYVDQFVTKPEEKAELQKWQKRIQVIGPYSVLSTRGPNPADEFTGVLFAHHDPKTLAWLDTPTMTVPAPLEVPVDVPPWWRMKKKTSMFYTGAGRGDHARIEMTASVLCTSSVDEARAIDAYFPDVRAYIASLDPPAWPFAIDHALADKGKPVFEATCSRCHGTYGPGGHYPNKLVTIEEIGTDGLLSAGTAEFAAPMIAWYKDSFFGELARLDPQKGYIAPPLDGVWATAPYLHNGSVPTIAALLDSTQRPRYWTRSFDSNDYDPQTLGWKHVVLDHGKKGEPDEATRANIYDTSLPGYANVGHTFGDVLTPDDRAAVLEYLKTL
jgi:mono/diheme cytochrome c family protein